MSLVMSNAPLVPDPVEVAIGLVQEKAQDARSREQKRRGRK